MGKAILKRWEFDPALIAVAAEHENVGRQPQDPVPDYVDLVQVANILSYEGTEHPLSHLDKSRIGSFERLNISVEDGGKTDTAPGEGGVEDIIS
jgi:HD-like signal output (HDOD) protein